MSSASSRNNHPAYALLARAHPPATAVTLFNDRVLYKPLTLRATSPDPTSQDARANRRRQRLRRAERGERGGSDTAAAAARTATTTTGAVTAKVPRRLSARQKRQLGIYEIPRSEQKFDLFVPLHRLWVGYMQEILGLEAQRNVPEERTALVPQEGQRKGRKKGQSAAGERPDRLLLPAVVGPILTSADYHGALFEVVRCRCVDRVGIRGIVVKDTKFTFELVTRDNTLKVIPKEYTLFRFEIPPPPKADSEPRASNAANELDDTERPYVFELNGSQMRSRAIDRANKKFKPQKIDD